MNTSQIITFIKEQFPNQDFIPLHVPYFGGNEKKYLIDTIDSTFVSSVGAYVDLFEEQMVKLTQSKKAIAIVNGTSALQIALQLAGVQRNEEVITQALTFVATANAIVYNGAVPVFLDVDIDTMGLSPNAVAAFLEEHAELREGKCYNKKTNRRISACVPMHTFGFPVHLNELLSVCAKWGIPIVEDAAESIGSTYHSKPTGSFGELGIFSFNGNKTITCGGGGAIVTNSVELGQLGKYLTTTAKVPHPYEFVHDQLGYNFRMPNVNAALACAQLEQLDRIIQNKRELAKYYAEFFQGIGIEFRTELPNTSVNYWLMCVQLENRKDRETFLKTTNENGVMTRPVWQLMTRLPMYQDCIRDEQKNAEYLEDRIVNIPSSYRS